MSEALHSLLFGNEREDRSMCKKLRWKPVFVHLTELEFGKISNIPYLSIAKGPFRR